MVDKGGVGPRDNARETLLGDSECSVNALGGDRHGATVESAHGLPALHSSGLATGAPGWGGCIREAALGPPGGQMVHAMRYLQPMEPT